MAVERIEYYTQKDGQEVLKIILKPTKSFPEGRNYFYTDVNDTVQDLIENHTWHLNKSHDAIYVKAHLHTPATGMKTIQFHTEYAFKLLGYYPDYIDHIDRLEIDNRNINLNVVTNQQNQRNRPVKGYVFNSKYNNFRPKCSINGEKHIGNVYYTEPEVLQVTYNLHRQFYSDYDYNFLKDRRNDLDILDLELTGQISSEEATYRHVMKYADNAWYYYRYNLEQYFKDNHIAIPDFKLDNQGFMIHPVTGERLCPY